MTNTTGSTADRSYAPKRVVTSETKPAYKTTEFYLYIIVSVAILIASAVVDEGEDGQGFGANSAWMYVAWLTVGYLISRGLAKAGSRSGDRDDA